MQELEVSKQREKFVDKLHDFTILLLCQPCHGRTFEQILRHSRPGPGFHVQGRLVPGGAEFSDQQMCVCLHSLARAHSPSGGRWRVCLLLGTGIPEQEEHVRFVRSRFSGAGTQLVLS